MANRDKSSKQLALIEQVVMKALESPRYKYRTVHGIARETKLDVARVREVLKSSPAVRQSFAKQDGEVIVCFKEESVDWRRPLDGVSRGQFCKTGGVNGFAGSCCAGFRWRDVE